MTTEKLRHYTKEQSEWTLTIQQETPFIEKEHQIKGGTIPIYGTKRKEIFNKNFEIKGIGAAKRKAKGLIEDRLGNSIILEDGTNIGPPATTQNWMSYTHDRITPINYKWKRYYAVGIQTKRIHQIRYLCVITPKQPDPQIDYNDENGYPYNQYEIDELKYQTSTFWTDAQNIEHCQFISEKTIFGMMLVGVKLCGYKNKLYCSNKTHRICLDTSETHSPLRSELETKGENRTFKENSNYRGLSHIAQSQIMEFYKTEFNKNLLASKRVNLKEEK